jgi:hypothetical protein
MDFSTLFLFQGKPHEHGVLQARTLSLQRVFRQSTVPRTKSLRVLAVTMAVQQLGTGSECCAHEEGLLHHSTASRRLCRLRQRVKLVQMAMQRRRL